MTGQVTLQIQTGIIADGGVVHIRVKIIKQGVQLYATMGNGFETQQSVIDAA